MQMGKLGLREVKAVCPVRGPSRLALPVALPPHRAAGACGLPDAGPAGSRLQGWWGGGVWGHLQCMASTPAVVFVLLQYLFVLLQYLPPGVIALVNFLGPLLFVFLVQLGNYPPNTEVNLTLVW